MALDVTSIIYWGLRTPFLPIGHLIAGDDRSCSYSYLSLKNQGKKNRMACRIVDRIFPVFFFFSVITSMICLGHLHSDEHSVIQ